MKLTLSTSHAADLLKQDENASWSYSGARALVEHLEQLEDETGTEIDFCPVAIRCEYSQWDSLQSWAEDYFGSEREACAEIVGEDCISLYAAEEDIRDYIRDRGELIEFDGGVIVSSF